MALLDPRNTPTSCTNARALELSEEALRQYQTYVGDAVATLDRALAADPGFVLGHVFRAGVLMTFGEHRFARDARANVLAAEALAAHANDRERGLTRAVRRLVDGDWDGACAAFDAVLVDHPRDVFAIQTAHLFDFFRGDAVNLRNRVSRVLPHWSPSVPGYSFVLGMHAFGLEECNQYDEAERAALHALAIEPRDGWSVHAATHVLEMRGRVEDGVAWLESRARDWAPESAFAYHLWWHLALFQLDRGNVERVLELYDRSILPAPTDIALTLVDASSLLWRLHLGGVDVAERMGKLADVWESKLADECGFYAFNDVHAQMTFVASGREASVARVIQGMEAACAGAPSSVANVTMTRDVGLPVARALRAFGAGRHDEAIEELERVRDRANIFGGSHAQRDVLTLTLIEAALRGGRRSVARHFLAERQVARPGSALAWRLAARA